MEEWKAIEEYDGRYEVSSFGRVRSLKREQRILKADCFGRYLQVGLYKNGVIKKKKVHRLVATAFIPNPENKPQVNHIDGNTKNNNIDNLEWTTAQENVKHSNRTLKRGKGRKIKQRDRQGNLLNVWTNAYQASESTGICRRNINSCCNGSYHSAGEFVWEWD